MPDKDIFSVTEFKAELLMRGYKNYPSKIKGITLIFIDNRHEEPVVKSSIILKRTTGFYRLFE